MPRSMTGFGRGEAQSDTCSVRAEVRSVNNRNLRVIFRMPEMLQGLEADMNKLIRDSAARGSLTVTFSVEDLSGDPGYALDLDAISYYRQELLTLDPDADIPPAALLTLPGIVRKKEPEELSTGLADVVMKALGQALEGLVNSREVEGKFIWDDMMARCAAIRKMVDSIEKRVPNMVEEYRKRLSERLGTLLKGVSVELTQDDLRKEIALYADRSDITEEITRMRSHLELMESMGAIKDAIGRKLEFVTQEMFREGNTMASKSGDPLINHDALDVKSEIEKLREQALNIE